jgi:hypothetical protein
MRVFNIDGIAGGFETLSTITTAKGFTSAKIAPITGSFTGKQARAVILSVETADIRFTIDGTTPTTTATTAVGHLLTSGSSYEITGEKNIANFSCINAVASNGAVVKCTYLF